MAGLKLTHDAANSDIKVESIVTNNGLQFGGSKDQGGLGNSAVYSGEITLGTTMDFTNGTSTFWVGSPGEYSTNPYGLTMATNNVNQSTDWNAATVTMTPNAVIKFLQFQSKNGTGSVEIDQVKISTGTYENTVASGDPETEAPVITLLGDNPLELNNGDVYTDPGATATDNVDGDLTASIVVAVSYTHLRAHET